MLAAIPPIAWSAAAITAAYALAQLWVRPGQALSVWPLYVVQCTVPLFLLGVLKTRLRAHVETAFLAADLVYTGALCAQLLGPDTHPSGIAGFVAVKLLAVAAFVPWRPQYQWVSVCGALLFYGICLPYSVRYALETHRLHLYALPLIAGGFSILGIRGVARQRLELARHALIREVTLGRLQLLLDHMPAACVVSDRENRYVYWNRAAESMFGYRAEEVLGKSVFEVITPPHLRDLSRRGIELTARVGNIGPLRSENLTKDGRRIVCEWSMVALRDADGSFFGVLSMCQDVTERHRDEEERRKTIEKLREVDRLRADFVATMSHELRNPLNAIMGYAGLLVEGTFGPLVPEQRAILERMNLRARELLELVNSALDVSRIESGQAVVKLEVVQPSAVLEDIQQGTAELQKPGVRIEWDIEPDLPALYTDATKVKVIVRNLLSNAVKYTDQGYVRVRARRSYPGVEISVSDSGRGIPNAELENIFRPFHQLRERGSEDPPGAGLGLYLVHRFAELLGAEIHVESEVGKGSTFTVKLPAQPPGTLLG